MAAMPIADLQSVNTIAAALRTKNSPWMSAIELLAKICDICAEVAKNEVMLLRVLELYSGNCIDSADFSRNRLDRQIMRDLVVVFQCRCHCVMCDRTYKTKALMLFRRGLHRPYLSTLLLLVVRSFDARNEAATIARRDRYRYAGDSICA